MGYGSRAHLSINSIIAKNVNTHRYMYASTHITSNIMQTCALRHDDESSLATTDGVESLRLLIIRSTYLYGNTRMRPAGMNHKLFPLNAPSAGTVNCLAGGGAQRNFQVRL